MVFGDLVIYLVTRRYIVGEPFFAKKGQFYTDMGGTNIYEVNVCLKNAADIL